MAERTIEYVDTKQLVWKDERGDGYVRMWMCLTCGASVLNKNIHDNYHKVGR